MSITIIKGASKSGKSLVANALRNNQISNKRGALLVDEASEAEVGPLIEKLLVGVKLPASPPADLGKLPWKPDCMVILVGSKASMLKDFEEALPGFTKHFGPVYTITTAGA